MTASDFLPARARLLALGLLALLWGGCAKRFVEVVYGVDLKDPDPQAQVVETPRYRSARSSFKSIAVMPPESCTSGVSAGFAWGGHDSKTAAVVPTDCRIWTAEIERAFSAAGYRVISWQGIHDESRRNNESVLRAAANQRADLVLIVNSMTTRDVKPGEDTRAVLKYFAASPAGEKLGTEELDSTEQQAIKEVVKKRLDVDTQDSSAPLALAATLDATVAEAATGESIWFYRRIAYRQGGRQQYLRFLLRGRDKYWRPTAAEQSGAAPTGGDASQLGADASTLTACRQSEAERTVLSDLVTTFVRGRN